ncbi:MAG: phosphoribosylformylglycinamidine synthase subunit PurL, partial [Deferribacterota bacterium]|nr:phosphoribosylformylglycinamidine synthase subunit PurL [Deferribacterota bacterium]
MNNNYINATLEEAKKLGLTEEEFNNIHQILKRKPNFLEMAMISALWSEHCSYKSSKIHLKKLPTKGENVLLGPGENAGVVRIKDDLCAVFKVESHNHPSYIEPYQGAATGVGGILRDIFAMGARPELLMDSLSFGLLDDSHNKYLVDKVVEGIADYGNCMGIPVVGGETNFDEVYTKNPLVNVFALGLVDKKHIKKASLGDIGNKILYVGAKTGRDGIHGASMASKSFDDDSESKRINVQIGDPFTEKLLLEACIELVEKDLVVGLQDMGAAGLTSSIFELALKSGIGAQIELDNVPLREEGMNPYEIMLSESQERMLVIVADNNLDRVKEIFNKWDLDAVELGKATPEKSVKIKWRGNIVADIPIKELDKYEPVYAKDFSKPIYVDKLSDNVDLKNEIDCYYLFDRLVRDPNICTKKWIYEQYDHMVRTNTVVLPGADASVVRIKSVENVFLAISSDSNGRMCYINPYEGAKHVVSEALLNISVAGSEPVGITNCLNFGNPDNRFVMWQFVKVIEGMRDSCDYFNVPIVSGNVSFYNETLPQNLNEYKPNSIEGNIYPTPNIVAVGKILRNSIDNNISFFKQKDSSIALLGKNSGSIGGSLISKYIGVFNDCDIPHIDLEKVKNLIKIMQKLASDNLVL